jgi:hypothetical protein
VSMPRIPQAGHICVNHVNNPCMPACHACLPCPQGVSLALSLHAPTQELRKTIVPSARAYPLPKLMAAVAEYQEASEQRVFVEYVVLSGVNDAPEQAHELGQLLQVGLAGSAKDCCRESCCCCCSCCKRRCTSCSQSHASVTNRVQRTLGGV